MLHLCYTLIRKEVIKMKHLLIRVWYEDGYYLEREINITYDDIQWTNNPEHGKVTDIIIDTY